MEIKQSTSFRVPVRLRATSDGSGMTGIAYTAVTVYLQKQAGASAVKPLTNSDWFEVDAVHMPGVYDLLLSTTDTDTPGWLKYSVAVASGQTFFGLVEIVANVEADTYARIGAPVGATISADVAAVKADTLLLRKYQEGRWKIHTTGPYANKLVYYDSDNTTVLISWNLFDSAGTPATTNPFERAP